MGPQNALKLAGAGHAGVAPLALLAPDARTRRRRQWISGDRRRMVRGVGWRDQLPRDDMTETLHRVLMRLTTDHQVWLADR